MASVAVIAGVLVGLILALIALTILLYCLCLRRKDEKDDGSRVQHQSESEYFEAVDFAKIRKNNMQGDEHIRNLNPSSETQTSVTPKDTTASHVEYYNFIQRNTDSSVTVDDTKTNSGVSIKEEKCSQYQSDCGYVNNTLVNNTEDVKSDTCDKRTTQIQKTIGHVDDCKHVIDSGTERKNQEQHRTNSPEADTYFILENTTSASAMNEKDISQTDTCVNGVSIVQTLYRDGKVPMSDNVDNVYLNQRKHTFDDQKLGEKGSDDTYFVLEKS